MRAYIKLENGPVGRRGCLALPPPQTTLVSALYEASATFMARRYAETSSLPHERSIFVCGTGTMTVGPVWACLGPCMTMAQIGRGFAKYAN